MGDPTRYCVMSDAFCAELQIRRRDYPAVREAMPPSISPPLGPHQSVVRISFGSRRPRPGLSSSTWNCARIARFLRDDAYGPSRCISISAIGACRRYWLGSYPRPTFSLAARCPHYSSIFHDPIGPASVKNVLPGDQAYHIVDNETSTSCGCRWVPAPPCISI